MSSDPSQKPEDESYSAEDSSSQAQAHGLPKLPVNLSLQSDESRKLPPLSRGISLGGPSGAGDPLAEDESGMTPKVSLSPDQGGFGSSTEALPQAGAAGRDRSIPPAPSTRPKRTAQRSGPPVKEVVPAHHQVFDDPPASRSVPHAPNNDINPSGYPPQTQQRHLTTRLPVGAPPPPESKATERARERSLSQEMPSGIKMPQPGFARPSEDGNDSHYADAANEAAAIYESRQGAPIKIQLTDSEHETPQLLTPGPERAQEWLQDDEADADDDLAEPVPQSASVPPLVDQPLTLKLTPPPEMLREPLDHDMPPAVPAELPEADLGQTNHDAPPGAWEPLRRQPAQTEVEGSPSGAMEPLRRQPSVEEEKEPHEDAEPSLAQDNVVPTPPVQPAHQTPFSVPMTPSVSVPSTRKSPYISPRLPPRPHSLEAAGAEEILQLVENTSHDSPFKGLTRFDAGDKGIYTGPRQLLADMLDALDEHNLLTVLGPAGSGKSSLIRAGLVPNYTELEDARVRSFVISPGFDPYLEIARVLADAGFERQACEMAREPSHYFFVRLASELIDTDEKWIIFIDQFEEFGRYRDEESPARYAAFASSLVELAEWDESPVKVIIALRDDFYWRLGQYPQLAEQASQCTFRMARLEDKELRQAINLPLNQRHTNAEDALVEHLLSDYHEINRCSLPLLQHALHLLWMNRREDQTRLLLDDYLSYGGLEGCLRRHLETVFSNLSDDEKFAMRQILLRLVDVSATLADTQGILVPLPQATPLADITDPHELAAVKQLIAHRLLLCSTGDRPVIELPIHTYTLVWPRFRRWMSEVQEIVALRNQIKESTERWIYVSSTRGEELGQAELWQAGHLEWALDLRLRGDFDNIGAPLNREENHFLDVSEEHHHARLEAEGFATAPAPGASAQPASAAPALPLSRQPAPTSVPPAPAPAEKMSIPDYLDSLTPKEIAVAVREIAKRAEIDVSQLAGGAGQADKALGESSRGSDPRFPRYSTGSGSAIPAVVKSQKDSGAAFAAVSATKADESAENGIQRPRVGGPELRKKELDEEDLRTSIQLTEMQHELLIREKALKKLRYIMIGIGALALIFMLFAFKGCLDSAKNATGYKKSQESQEIVFAEPAPDFSEELTNPTPQ